MSETVQVVILAAGLGTRMRSRRAKVLHEAGGLPLVEHVVRTALTQAKAADVQVVVGHQAERVQDRLAGYGVGFTRQAEQLGTGHAVRCCAEAMRGHNGRVVILYGDSPLLSVQTLARLVAAAGDLPTVLTTRIADPTGYGRIVRAPDGRVRAIVEQKAGTPQELAINEINSGIYCFPAELLWPLLERLEPNPASGEYYLTDVVAALADQGRPMQAFELGDPDEVLGINTRLELAVADRILRERKVRQLMLDGVTIEKPETVAIDTDVQVGSDTVVEAGARLLGRTVVGEECRIGAGSILRDAVLGDGVELLPYTVVERSHVRERTSIGPFARLRQGNVVGPGAHIGNFVELKNARFGEGSKAGHLAYLGDAEIGPGVNIGAGTITCNYDGVQKHGTTIGQGAFVGSNSTLVAPVEVGKDSYVAAGSVITEAVPPDALGIGRGRQATKEGWARRRREKTQSGK